MEPSADCKNFIKINEACSAEIEEHCSGNFFHGDTMICLTQWTKPESLGAGCAALMPKVVEEDEEDDAEKARWKASRKAARDQAMKDIKKEQGGDKKKRRKAKKNT